MKNYTIYHNPRCSKSRQALQLLADHGIVPTIVLYIKEPLDSNQLSNLLKQLNISAYELIRTHALLFKKLNLANKILQHKQVIALLSEYPSLMQRPIVSNGSRAIIARPADALLEIL